MKTRRQLSHFLDSQVVRDLAELRQMRVLLVLPRLFQMLLRVASMVVFFSIFFSFFRVFLHDVSDSSRPFVWGFLGVFGLIMAIVMYSVISKAVRTTLKPYFPGLSKGPGWVGLTLVAMAIFVFAVWQVNLLLFPSSAMEISFIYRFVLVLAITMGAVMLGGVFAMPIRHFERRFQRRILPALWEFLLPNAKYETKGAVPQAFFEESGLYHDGDIVRYRGEHLVREPAEGDVQQMMSMLRVRKKKVKKTHGSSKISVYEAFSGLFLVTRLRHPSPPMIFQTKQFTGGKRWGKKVEELMTMTMAPGWKPMETGKEDFDQKYLWVMPGESAQVVLSPEMLNCLALAEAWAEEGFQFSVKGEFAFLALSKQTSIFSPNMQGDLLDVDQLEGFQKLWESLYGLSRVLTSEKQSA